MTVTTTNLTRAAAVAAAVAGAIFIGVQINHPPMDTFLTDTNEWVIRCTAKLVMAALALAGITGIYLRQVRQMRVLGLIGFVVFASGYLLVFATEAIAVFVLPALTEKAPAFVNDVVIAAAGAKPNGDIGHLQILFNLMGIGYLLGGLIFGIALFRAGVLARWAAVLLAVSTVATGALAVLPESFDRPMAVPEGVALIALGISLWRDQRQTARTAAPTTAGRAQRSPMTTQPLTTRRTRRDRPRGWPVPAALLTLSVIPLAAGTLRLVQLAGGPELIPADHRFASFPAPLVLHIVGAAIYAVVGVFQFVPRFRRRHRTWHRRAGRVLTVAGLLVAVSALWMTLLYAAKPGTGDLLYVLRLVFGVRAGRLSGAGFHRHPPPRHRSSPRLDDPGLRHRPGRRHPGLHRRHRRRHLRDRRTPR